MQAALAMIECEWRDLVQEADAGGIVHMTAESFAGYADRLGEIRQAMDDLGDLLGNHAACDTKSTPAS
jgi:hypothetical protein